MRIIAGHAKGTRLLSPKSRSLRPTKDRVREALFSSLGPKLAGASFLDLFAGTGANGIEALSRGADHVDFVDSDPESRDLIGRNLHLAKTDDRGDIHSVTLPSGLEQLAKTHAPYDIVFADPPYGFDELLSLLDLLRSNALVDADGIVILEHASGRLPEHGQSGFLLNRIARYGDSALAYFTLTETGKVA